MFIRKMLGALVLMVAMGLIAVLFSAAAYASDYYVDCSAGTNGSGTSASPYNSFNSINTHGAFSAGDRILLKRGVTCNQQMTVSGTGTSSSYIEIGAYGTGTSYAKIIRNGLESDRAIRLTSPAYWKVHDLEIGSAGTGILVYFDAGGRDGSIFSNLSLLS